MHETIWSSSNLFGTVTLRRSTDPKLPSPSISGDPYPLKVLPLCQVGNRKRSLNPCNQEGIIWVWFLNTSFSEKGESPGHGNVTGETSTRPFWKFRLSWFFENPGPLGHFSDLQSPSYSWRRKKRERTFHTSCVILTIRLVEEIRRSPVDMVNISHVFTRFGLDIPGGCSGFLPSTVPVTKCFSRAPSSSMLSSSSGISTSFQDMWASWIEPASLQTDGYTSACIYVCLYACMYACMCILGIQLELHDSHTHMTYTLIY